MLRLEDTSGGSEDDRSGDYEKDDEPIARIEWRGWRDSNSHMGPSLNQGRRKAVAGGERKSKEVETG